MPLHLSQAQQLSDALGDALFKPALQEFIRQRRLELNEMLLVEAKKPEHSPKQVAYLAGQIEAHETLFSELEKFAEDSLRTHRSAAGPTSEG